MRAVGYRRVSTARQAEEVAALRDAEPGELRAILSAVIAEVRVRGGRVILPPRWVR